MALHLERLAAAPEGGELAVSRQRALIDRAIAVHDFVDYGETWSYFAGVDEAIDELEALLRSGHAAEVVDLAEHALKALEEAIEQVDDSDGGAAEPFARLEQLHHEACVRAPVDVLALAERLLERELGGQWDVFDRAVLTYADVLGKEGLARYRALAEERWATVPALGPGDERGHRHDRFAITRVMRALAELAGRLDEAIAVYERDLSSPYSFLQAAELCRAHGEPDAALEWADRGLGAFEGRRDPRLRAFARDEYRRRGCLREALELSSEAYEAAPALDAYRELKADAEALAEWDLRRPSALELLRARSEPGHSEGQALAWAVRRNHSELVRILLWEREDDAAWVAATEGGCPEELWLELASRRRDSQPADALEVYQRQVEARIARKDKRAYRAAVQLMGEVRSVLEQIGRAHDFAAYVERVREAHKRKRNLVKLLDALA